MADFEYTCKDCFWSGPATELDLDKVETCFGEDEIELCPKCGSINVLNQKSIR